jgi:hypothetical protein
MKKFTLKSLHLLLITTIFFYLSCNKSSTSSAGSTVIVSTLAQLSGPAGIAANSEGILYVQDSVLSLKCTATGQWSQINIGASAYPFGMAAIDGSLYIINQNREIARYDTISNSSVVLVTGLNSPFGLAADIAGNIYVTDQGTNQVFRISEPLNILTLIAGNGSPGSADGLGIAASFNKPAGICIDQTGNLYIADNSNNKIRKITVNGIVSTVAGTGLAGSTDGKGNTATFNDPIGIAADSNGNVFVSDYGNNKIRKITANGEVSTLAGTGIAGLTNGPANLASFKGPFGITTGRKGFLYVTDAGNNSIRMITQ